MSETVTEQRVCPKCEAEVRPNTAFCYNCGGSFSQKETAQPVADETPRPVGEEIPPPVPEDKTARPTAVAEKVEAKETLPAPGLRSASDIRRRERTSVREPRKVKWEPREDKANIQLIIATVVILAFSVIVIVLALYLR
jgi:hypothetical protein